jgi:ribosomal protein L16/L10AE
MDGNSFEMYATERLATQAKEAAAFAAQRAMVRGAGGGFWTHLFGVMPVPRRRADKAATPRASTNRAPAGG